MFRQEHISLAFLILLQLALAASSKTVRSPADSKCVGQPEGVLFPYQQNCSMYIECNGGKSVVMMCPSGLLYDITIQECNWASEVSCGFRPRPGPSPTQISPKPATSPSTPAPPMTTPPPSKSTPTPGAECVGQPEGVLFPYEQDCSMYIECNGGKSVVMMCPSGLLYDIRIQECNWASQVNCGSRPGPRPIPTQTSPKPVPSPSTPAPPKTTPPPSKSTPTPGAECVGQPEGVLFPYQQDCSMYIECNGGKSVVMMCPSGLLYDIGIQECNWASQVSCGSRPVRGPRGVLASLKTVQSPPDTQCVGQPEGVLFPYQDNCAMYIECNGGKSVVMMCPSGLLYDINTHECNWASEVSCGSRPGPGPTPTQTSPKPVSSPSTTAPPPPSKSTPTPGEECVGQPEGDLFPYEQDCSMYIECNGGKSVVMMCPSGLLYDIRTRECNWASQVNCGSRPVPGPKAILAGFKQTDGICVGQPDAALFSDPEDCSKFIECIVETPISVQCPKGMLFDETSKKCQTSSAVQCRARPTQGTTTGTPVTTRPTNPPASTTPGKPDPFCAGKPEGSSMRYPDDCAQFIECVGGKSLIMKCPAGTLYDPVTNNCNFADMVDCNAS